jgi:general secretion pathway protein H
MIWRNNSRGFTMIEMIVVIAVLGLALSVVVGFAARGHPGLDLASAADGLAGTLRSARVRAITRQSTVMFTPLAAGRGYAIDGVVHSFPADVSLTAGAGIRFAPDGSSSGGVLRLATGGRAKVLQVEWLTGQVRIADAP